MEQKAVNLKNLSVVDIAIGSDILWLIFVLVLAIFLIFSLILVYHWNRFGMRALAIGTAELVFFAGGAFLLMGAAASIALF